MSDIIVRLLVKHVVEFEKVVLIGSHQFRLGEKA